MDKVKLVLGTKNKDKISEIIILLSDISDKFEFLPLTAFVNAPKVIEDGKTLEENAIKKAKMIAESLRLLTVSEDTGLEVEYLDGAPGMLSARFADEEGKGCTYEDNNRKLLSMLNGVPTEKRSARFRCIACVASLDGKIYTAEGTIDGYIASEMRGTAGFGYDPVFLVPQFNKTFAELGLKIKNKISHRAIAFEKIKKILLEIIQ
ncbi:MAG: RdgB/HAM1 family non-canonical purine NTP pyrophosphatase [Elusimicrobiota bacterium]|nr:RdgB/HAM1 family non-canonical purine NTP pyrophosphatase [Elusimicrobiota bacterium]